MFRLFDSVTNMKGIFNTVATNPIAYHQLVVGVEAARSPVHKIAALVLLLIRNSLRTDFIKKYIQTEY